MTDTIQANVLYIPYVSISFNHIGNPILLNPSYILGSIENKILERISEGIFAPSIVIQSTPHNNNNIKGIPNILEETTLSIFSSLSKALLLVTVTT